MMTDFLNDKVDGVFGKTWLLFVIMLFIMAFAHAVYANVPVVMNDDKDCYPLGKHLDIMEDKKGTITINEATDKRYDDKYFRCTTEKPNFGFTDSVFWARFTISNTTSGSRDFLLELDYPSTDYVTLFTPAKNGTYEGMVLGDLVPFQKRLIKNRKPIFIINMEPGETKTYYMKFDSQSSMQLLLYLWKPNAFFSQDHDEQLLFGLFFGIILSMILYNFFIFFTLRDTEYLAYIVYILVILLFLVSYTGFLYEYIDCGSPGIAKIALPFLLLSCSIMATLFIKLFLKTSVSLPLLDKYFNLILMLASIGIAGCFLVEYRYSIRYANFIVMITEIGALASSVTLLSRGFKPARFFLSAWFLFIFGGVLLSLQDFGIVANTFISKYSVMIGDASGVILLSFALGDRINLMRQEKEYAQLEALRIQREATETLENKVVERTRELNDAYAKLKELDDLKSSFFANVSHEIRTPLTLMLTPVQAVLEGTYGREPDREFYEILCRNGTVLLHLINNLLDFSKLDAGRMVLDIRRVDIIQLVKENIASVRSLCELNGIGLEMDCRADTLMLYIDSQKIDRVLSNLFSNAIKYTERGGRISVRVIKGDDGCVIEFDDTGIGIPSERISSVFERFTQADSGTTRRHGGTGIGLAIAREFLELHCASIEVVSRHINEHHEDHGTRFTISIPFGCEHLEGKSWVNFSDNEASDALFHIVPGAIRAKDPVVRSNDAASGQHREDDRPLILVVEDNPDMHRLIENIMSGSYRLCKAMSGVDALEKLKMMEEPPDLILADIMMPEMDGCEMTRHVRGNPALEGVPIILLTARSDTDMKLVGFEKGATDYITKPFNARELAARIRAQIEMKRLRDRLKQANRNLYRRLENLSARNDNVPGAEIEEKVRIVMDFIRDNYTAELSREGLAAAVNMSPDRLSRVFNRINKKRIDEYINELRIAEAARRLQETSDSVIFIALEVGFESLRHFNRVFHKAYNLSPTQFRSMKKS